MNQYPTVEELKNIVDAYIKKNEGQSTELSLLDSGKIDRIIKGTSAFIQDCRLMSMKD